MLQLLVPNFPPIPGGAFVLVTVYVIYQRLFHPLAKVPGPFWASLTDLWKFQQLLSLQWPEKVAKAHETYGPIVRLGPNDVYFTSPDSIQSIYKSGRSMPKSNFYSAFTAFKPNIFGMQDEDLHSQRRRQMSRGFSKTGISKMEQVFDKNIIQLRKKLDKCAESQTSVDLKEVIAYYMYDVLGEIAFDATFNSQTESRPECLPPINEHIFLSCLLGSSSSILSVSRKVIHHLPIPWLQNLLEGRKALQITTEKCVRVKMEQASEEEDKEKVNLLDHLLAAKDPETGARLDFEDLASEAFLFIVAGSHTTSSTLTLLFAHLLSNPHILQQVVEELDENLPFSEAAYSDVGLENKLPILTACVRENFRINPVFTMPLPRVITAPGGIDIGGMHIPQGTNVSVCNYAIHRSASIWGPDSNRFDPNRWLRNIEDTESMLNYLMPFGAGHRACIGRNIAMTNIYKLSTTLLRNYNLEQASKEREVKTQSVGLDELATDLKVWIQKRDEGNTPVPQSL
ncbi:hypothetical protein OIDMADRAFT_139359 [Oidiodendron maius Zn]|uniref:Cytochrome P450 monooxygenase n=1 Tax=Oidiodendron maius (strain Zn) TaxID=913774 RepID=A0A0C3CSK8_OIDMZ|nr:hypothetical protein OIDMADRAFT_139359 [Oidiodendron maius Zn]